MKIRKKVILFFSNNLPLQIWTLKCSLQFCRYDVSAHPTPVLNLANFMYKHLLGAYRKVPKFFGRQKTLL